MDDLDQAPVDYERALMEVESYLRRSPGVPHASDLPALLAAWAAEGEGQLYPMRELDPARRSAEAAAA